MTTAQAALSVVQYFCESPIDDESNVYILNLINLWNRGKSNKVLILCNGARDSHERPILYSEYWVELYSNYDFFMHFRMQKQTFHNLLNAIMQESNLTKLYPGGFHPITPEKMQQVSIYYLAYQIPLLEIGDKFGLATSTVFKAVELWMDSLHQLTYKIIKWPTENERVDIEYKFHRLAGFPGTIGALDGCHINVMAPAAQQRSYQNRYTTHSIILQGICTADCLLTNVFIGYPGSANDSRVLSNSTISRKIEEFGAARYLFPHQHLLGDKIYPLREWLLPPFKDYGRMSASQKRYNKLHSRTRVKIENCFGLLKGRWRRLKYIQVYNIEKASKIVLACCLLHNFCLLNNDLAEDLTVLVDEINRVEAIQVVDRYNDRDAGRVKRDNIMLQFA